MGKGVRKEREHVRELFDLGVPALRTPASGGATDRPLPDLFFRANGENYAIEQKYSSGDYIYFGDEEVEALCEFAEMWDSIPLFCARFKGDTTFYFKEIDQSKFDDEDRTWGMKRGSRDEYFTIFDLIPAQE